MPVTQICFLQVKNIIYHAVKDALAILNHYDSEDEDN